MKSKLFSALTVFVLSVRCTFAQGVIFVYDQQSGVEDIGEGGGGIQSNQPIGQSFTPTFSSVGFIRLWLYDGIQDNGLGATVYVNLRTDSITGPVLSSTDPVVMLDNFGRGVNEYPDFFFSTPVAVTPGMTYYFQPVVQSGDSWGIVGAYFNYPGGVAFVQGGATPFNDLWFREGIIIPEPSSALLVLFGGGVLVALRHVRRARQTRRAA